MSKIPKMCNPFVGGGRSLPERKGVHDLHHPLRVAPEAGEAAHGHLAISFLDSSPKQHLSLGDFLFDGGLAKAPS